MDTSDPTQMHASRTSALPQTRWRKSTRSGGTGDCVEVADLAANVGVRDSKDPDAQHLAFALNTWTAFVAEVRDGRFDLP